MKNLIQAVVVTLFAASMAQAQQAVQWRVQDGGNGRWYQVVGQPSSWEQARTAAIALGGQLTSITSAAENEFVRTLVIAAARWRTCGTPLDEGVWIGGFRNGPNEAWQWIDGSAFVFSDWCGGQFCCWPQSRIQFSQYQGCEARWDDHDPGACFGTTPGFVVQWSADCNADGVVDYGQILQGQLPDSNTNGVPDGCECAAFPTLPACCAGDLNRDSAVDGADLGTLLNSWGDCPGTCPADFDRNGFVDGADLGVLLGRWGPCGG
jgi:hypothetical protein